LLDKKQFLKDGGQRAADVAGFQLFILVLEKGYICRPMC